jgi:hypothetical protein
MRNSYISGLAAVAVGLSIVGASAAPMDFMSSAVTRADDTAASMQPPPGFHLNKGFAAFRPEAGGASTASGLVSNPEHYSISRADTPNNLLSPPDSLKNQLLNDQLLAPDRLSTGETNDLLRPPPK